MTRKSKKKPSDSAGAKSPTKLDTLISLLKRSKGATIAELARATGWQNHSVRGALAGTLKKNGHVVSSDVVDGVRRYRLVEPAA